MTNSAVPEVHHASLSAIPVELSRLEPLRPLPLHDVSRAMQEYQAGLGALLAETDWQVFRDRDGRERRFVKRGGWRKVATWFGLDLYVGRITVEKDDAGRIALAEVVGRVVAPNGRTAEDVGCCSADERRFSKPEHDIRATATTRALNRATSNLVGMGEVTAEEMLDDVEPLLPDWAQFATDEVGDRMLAQLTELVGEPRAHALRNGIDSRYGGTPNVVTGIVNALHRMLSAPPAEDLTKTSDDAARDAATGE